MIPGRAHHVTATTAVATTSSVLHSVVVGVGAVGQTLEVHNCASTGTAAPSNLVSTIALDDTDGYLFGGAYLDVGLVAVVSGGAPDVTIVTD